MIALINKSLAFLFILILNFTLAQASQEDVNEEYKKIIPKLIITDLNTATGEHNSNFTQFTSEQHKDAETEFEEGKNAYNLWKNEESVNTYKRAKKLLITAVKQGHEEAQVLLDQLNNQRAKKYYLEAVSLEEDGRLTEAAVQYKNASKKGHAKAAYSLAHFYFNGTGVEQSEKKGIKYLHIAKLKGYTVIEEKSDAIQLNKQVVIDNSSRVSQDSSIQQYSKIRKVGEAAKTIDFISKNLQLGLDILSIPLTVFGYENLSKNLEKWSLFSKLIAGVSKITYGTTDTIITKDQRHLLTIAIGVTQVGSSYLQYDARERYNKLKIEQNKLQKEKESNLKLLELLQQEKLKIEERLKEYKNGEINEEEFRDYENAWNEAQKKQEELLDQYNLVTNQQKYCSFQTLGLECTEEVCDKTFTDLKDDKLTWQESLTKNIMFVTVSAAKKFFSEAIKENKEEVRSHLQSLFENIKCNLKNTKLADFMRIIEKGDNNKKMLNNIENELKIS